MRGGRNKFGPMYKRDRARKLQLMRQRQLALQTIRGNLGDPCYSSTVAPLLHIKQEIQIPQVSSLTSSPDSSPSPATVAAGLVTTQAGAAAAGQHQLIAPSNQPGIGTSGGSGGGGTGNHNLHNLNPGLESKLWAANSTTTPGTKTFGFGEQSGQPHGGGNAAGYTPTPAAVLKSSPMIRDFLASIDDREWQSSLFGLLQSQTYNQCEVDLFELMCKVLDQNLFSQVDWARNSTFFKDLKVSRGEGERRIESGKAISRGAIIFFLSSLTRNESVHEMVFLTIVLRSFIATPNLSVDLDPIPDWGAPSFVISPFPLNSKCHVETF